VKGAYLRYSRYECTQLTKIGTSVLIYVSSSSIVQPDAGWSPRRRQARQHPGPEDGFIHYQLLRFCQATRLQYLNGHITLADQNVLHWAPLPVVFAMLKRSPRPAQQVWLSDNDLQGPTSWDARPLCTLMRLHEDLLRNFDCTDQPVAPQPPPASGAGGGAAGVRLRWAHTRSLGTQAPRTAATASWFSRNSPPPQAFKRSQIPSSASSSSQDQQPNRPTPIPTQRRLTQQLTKHWAPFKALRQRYAGTRFEEQRQLHLPQKHSPSRDEQDDNAKARELLWKPMSLLGTIRPTSANDAFDPALWATFVSKTLGLGVPVLSSLPRLHNSPLAMCSCKKHALDLYGDHTSTCTAHSGATKAHDGMVGLLGPLFRIIIIVCIKYDNNSMY